MDSVAQTICMNLKFKALIIEDLLRVRWCVHNLKMYRRRLTNLVLFLLIYRFNPYLGYLVTRSRALFKHNIYL